MPLDPRLSELAEELFGALGRISVRNMFGGGGVYCDGVMFALIAYGVIYLKADARSRPSFEAEGLGPFVYHGKAKPVAMSYWRMPERLLDDPDEAVGWGREALRAMCGQRGQKQNRAARADPAARLACLDGRLLAADFHRTRGLSEEGRHVFSKATRVRA